MSTGDPWTITNRRHDADALGQHNSIFTISNGYLGLKGNLQEDRDGYCPVTLINGVYDEIDQFGTLPCSNEERPYLDPGAFAAAGASPAVANLPNPLFVRIFVADREVSFGHGEVRDFEQSLDLRTGAYRYRYDYRSAGGTTRVEMMRFASLKRAHRVFMRYTLTPLDHDASIRILSGIDADVVSNTTRQRQCAVSDADIVKGERCQLHARTPARGHDVHLAVQHTCRGAAPTAPPRGIVEHDAVYTCYEFAPKQGRSITIERCIVATCSEDARHGVAVGLEQELDAAVAQGYDAALEEQRAEWASLWEIADVEIEGDERAQRYLRFCLYHLLAAAPRHTDRLSVPVKLLSGEYYQGNTFYDSDLYIVPVYTFTFPQLARTCLNYRYKGLTCARALARELGYRGAKFAWQAGPYGEECLGKWYRFCHTNIHINADVVYSLMQYYRATGDEAFLQECGIDILVETARFYHSRAALDTERGGLTFEHVAGPDEAHCRSTSNFYTNYLARRNLRWAADAVDMLRERNPEMFDRTSKRLRLAADEPARWRETADELILLFDKASKLYEQCEGFFRLPGIPADLSRDRPEWFAPIYPYQAANQPDVVMALTLLRDDFPADVRQANWEFYKSRSMDFSSMSFAVNAIAAADAGDLDAAYQGFITAAGVDLDEQLTGRRDTHAGLHGTALGGAWLAVIFGFAGVELSERGLRIEPRLPAKWTRLRFRLAIGETGLRITIDRREISLQIEGKLPLGLPLRVAGELVALAPRQILRIPCGQ